MGLFDIFKRNSEEDEQLRQYLSPDAVVQTIMKKDALKVNTVYACINIISNSIASLPFDLYQRTADGRVKAVGHKLYSLCKYPSLDMSGYNFRQALLVNLLIYGNAYIEIIRLRGQVRELNLIPSDKVNVIELADGRLEYDITSSTGTQTIYSDEGKILHITGNSTNGKIGISPIEIGMKSIVLARSLEAFGINYFDRGARPSGFLKTQKKLTEEAVARLKKGFANYMGSANSGKMIVLEDGMEYEIAQNGNDSSQFLESRRLQISEIARLYSVPLHLLQETEKSTSWGSGLEQLNTSFVQMCLSPYLKRIEDAFGFALLTERERKEYYFEFNVEGLLRGDTQSRIALYHSAIQDGWMSPNDVRRLENMPAIENGDIYLIPLNMQQYSGDDNPDLEGNK